MMDQKKRVMKLFAGFFIIMLCCTVISRAADSVIVPRVEAGHIKSGRLTSKFHGSGTIQAAETASWFLPEGQKIKKILVKPGDKVEKGRDVAELDAAHLKERFDEQSREVEQINLQIEQQKLTGSQDFRVPETAAAEVALTAAGRELERAQEVYRQSVDAYQTFTGSSKVSMAEEEYQAYLQEEERLSGEMDAAEASVTAFREAYDQAFDQYHLSERREEAMRANEEKKGQVTALSLASLQVDLDAAKLRLFKLQEIQSQNGRITSEAEGVFTSVEAKEGTVTTGSEQVILAVGGYRAMGILPEDAGGVITAGDKVNVTISGSTKPAELTIERIERSAWDASNPDQTDTGTNTLAWFARLEGENYQLGTVLEYEIRKSSREEYQKIVPISALHTAQGAEYVLVVKQRSTMLGNTSTAVKVLVTVLNKDNESAAIAPGAALDREDDMIVSSNKYVEGGDRVRISRSDQ